MNKDTCRDCLLKKEKEDCRFAFCQISFLKKELFDLITESNNNVNTICEALSIDRKQFIRFAKLKFGKTPKELIDALRLVLVVEKYDESLEFQQILILSGFNNSRNFRNILHKNYNMTAKIFINEVKMVKISHEKTDEFKRKLLYNNE
jgi:methylphosphotriester-DNA--protein-cysteine methyltransferase